MTAFLATYRRLFSRRSTTAKAHPYSDSAQAISRMRVRIQGLTHDLTDALKEIARLKSELAMAKANEHRFAVGYLSAQYLERELDTAQRKAATFESDASVTMELREIRDAQAEALTRARAALRIGLAYMQKQNHAGTRGIARRMRDALNGTMVHESGTVGAPEGER